MLEVKIEYRYNDHECAVYLKELYLTEKPEELLNALRDILALHSDRVVDHKDTYDIIVSFREHERIRKIRYNPYTGNYSRQWVAGGSHTDMAILHIEKLLFGNPRLDSLEAYLYSTTVGTRWFKTANELIRCYNEGGSISEILNGLPPAKDNEIDITRNLLVAIVKLLEE